MKYNGKVHFFCAMTKTQWFLYLEESFGAIIMMIYMLLEESDMPGQSGF